jgi:hypothetical protein
MLCQERNNRMKNKIFELYKDKSLTEFLEFKKENPKENFVYVLQHPPANINILSASNFGYLVICLAYFDQVAFNAAPFVFKMRKELERFYKARLYIAYRRSGGHWYFLCYSK